ncbi:MAG: hypothetical protein L0Y36_07880 [Planctomycetales bacterium]|nr:hypothetical protein [Planctomycetales bacterium]
MKQWLTLSAAVIVLSSLTLGAPDLPQRPVRERAKPVPPAAVQPDRPVAAERLGNAIRQQQERLDRLEQVQRRLMERMEIKPAVPPMHTKARPYEAHKRFWCMVMLVCAVVHVLAAVWVFQDIRARGAGSGLWIVIALLAGLMGVLVYAVIRIGDAKKT